MAVCATAVGGVLPVIDNLSHGCCHAASVGMAVRSVGVFRAECIVVWSLVPSGGYQRSNHITAAAGWQRITSLEGCPLGLCCRRGCEVIIYHSFNLLLVVAQPFAYLHGHILRVEVVIVGVGQNGVCTLVGGHNHEPLGLQCNYIVAVGHSTGEAVGGAARINHLHGISRG